MAYLFGAANSDRIDCGTSVTTASTFSIFVRFKVTAANTVYRALATFANSTTGVEYQMFLAFGAGTTNILTFGFGHGGIYPALNWTSGFTAGSTHTLVGTYDGANLKLYADTDATPKATLAETNTPDTTSIRFQIGQDMGYGNDKSADSTIYEVGWWPGTVLTGAQAAAIGAATAPVIAPTNYWPLVSDAVATFGGQNGTVTGASVVAHAGINLYGAGSAVTETFTHADSPGSLTATQTWTLVNGTGLGILSNHARNADATVTHQIARCDTATADADDFDVDMVLQTFPTEAFAGTVQIGVMARMVAGAVTGYELRLAATNGVYQLNLYRWDAGPTENLLGSVVDLQGALGANPVAGDALRLRVTGSTLTGFFTHSGTETQIIQRTEATYGASRRLGGLHMLRTSTDDVEVDNWRIFPATSSVPPDTTPPVCTITVPTAGTTYATALGELTVAGTATDDVAVASVTWSSDKGPSGTATGTTSWSIPLLPLYNGANVLTVTAHDTSGNTHSDTLTLTSTPRFAISGNTQMANEAAISPTLGYWPDSGQGIINNLDGTYTFLGSCGGSLPGVMGKAVGTFTNPLSVSSGHVALSGQKDTPDALAAAIHYAAGGPVYVDPGSGMWIMIVHYETLVHPGSGFYGTQYYSQIGIAKSTDQGGTWTDCGIIITPYHTRAEMDAVWAANNGAAGNFYNAEVGWGPYLIIDGYLYVYYIYVDGEIQAGGGLTYQEGMGVARALLSDVVTAAATATVPTFHKYHAGTWTELGIHGFGSKVIPRYVGLTYSTTRNRFLGLRITDFTGSGKIEFGYYESDDGVTWSPTPEIVQTADTLVNPASYWYWTLVDPANALPLVSDDTFYICSLGRDVGNINYRRWTVTLDASAAPANAALLRSGAWRGEWRGELV